MKSTHKILNLVICLILVLPLAGCFKGEISLDIHPDGSATLGGSYGLNQQAKILLNMQGSDLAGDLFGVDLTDASVRASSWVDGDYEWVKAETDLKDIDEVNSIINQAEFFKHFALIRKTGIFQNQIFLAAEVDFSSTEGTTGDLLGLSASDLIDFRFLARMPGKILEKNGVTDINDPNLIVWNINVDGITPIYAKSVTWNYLNIGLFAAGIILFILLIILLIVLLLVRKRKKSMAESLPGADSTNYDNG